MRIRQIKPSWWLDKPLRHLTADVREFYIGLWQLADDGGWFTWDVARIAAELYPYAGVSRRERNVTVWGGKLTRVSTEHPHLVVFSCGHAQVPKMAAHQRITGKQSTGTKERHLGCRNSEPLLATVSLTLSEPFMATDSPGRVGNGRERNGTSREATPPDGGLASEFQAKVPRPFIVVGKPVKGTSA